MSEPINLHEWRAPTRQRGSLYTCGRSGRATYGRRRGPVEITVIDEWVAGLPNADQLHLVSLLGSKEDGYSEFAYYPFRSCREHGDPKPIFEDWLGRRYGPRFIVHEFPTVDANGEIPEDVLDVITAKVLGLLEAGCTVIVMDSAGSQRTRRVCETIGFRRR